MATKKKSSNKASIFKQIGIAVLAVICVGIVGLAGYGTYTIVQNCSTSADEETEQTTDDVTTGDETVVDATSVVNISGNDAVLTVVA